MAWTERFHKTLSCRMLLLPFWAVFICCLLYVSREKKLSDNSPVRLHSVDLPLSRSERSSQTVSRSDRDQCMVGLPTHKDLQTLKRLVKGRKHHTRQSVVHCSVVQLCHSRRFQADCFSHECKTFDVHVKESSHLIPSASREELSEIVETNLQQNTFMFVDDLNLHIDIHCHDNTASKLELTGDVISSENCDSVPPLMDSDTKHRTHAPKNNIHVLYFRFLSRWEFQFSFPGLVLLVKKYSEEGYISHLSFDKFQATRWGDDELLSLLLQGKTGPFDFQDSLLNTLDKEGYCFSLEDFSCSRSHEQEVLLTNITSSQGGVRCQNNRVRHHNSIMERLCIDENMTETKVRSVLTSLLYNVHQLKGERADPRPVFSVSVINIRDFKQSEVMDQVLRNFFMSVMTQKNRVVLMLSGMGNPSLLRLDQDVRLQLLASSPFMMMSSTANTSLESFQGARHITHSSFSMQGVYHFLQRFISKQHELENPQHWSFSSDFYSDESNTCESLHVKPPFMCLCDEQFVQYENDTLMTSFAEFAVGIINSRLQQLQHLSSSQEKQSVFQCAKVSGVSFADVQVGRAQDKIRILMNLHLTDALSHERMDRRAVLDIWDTDKRPQAELQFYTEDSLPTGLLHFQTDNLLKTMCKMGEQLDFHTSSETGLLKHWSQERHFGRKATLTHLHDNCLYLLVRDYGDSVSVEAANVCRDRRYDVMLHLSLINMMSLSPLPLAVTLGHAQREFVAAAVKISYSVATFAYKLDSDFDVFYDI